MHKALLTLVVSAHPHRYKDILVSMMESILRKIQLHFNIDELREVDDDTIDDDVRNLPLLCQYCYACHTASLCVTQNETEWQSFLRQSLEFVGKVSELFPPEAFQMLFPLLQGYSQIYLSLQAIIYQNQEGGTYVCTCGHMPLPYS